VADAISMTAVGALTFATRRRSIRRATG